MGQRIQGSHPLLNQTLSSEEPLCRPSAMRNVLQKLTAAQEEQIFYQFKREEEEEKDETKELNLDKGMRRRKVIVCL